MGDLLVSPMGGEKVLQMLISAAHVRRAMPIVSRFVVRIRLKGDGKSFEPGINAQ